MAGGAVGGVVTECAEGRGSTRDLCMSSLLDLGLVLHVEWSTMVE
jgi:hypothetical protein